jgi:sirohydrochlorin ferrochelatase
MEATIILAHGSVRKETTEVMDQLLRQLNTQDQYTDMKLSVAYLQLAEPGLGSEVKRLYAEGVRKIALVPMFIFDGVHVTQDIPAECKALEKELPGLSLKLGRHIGADPLLAQILADRITELQTV